MNIGNETQRLIEASRARDDIEVLASLNWASMYYNSDRTAVSRQSGFSEVYTCGIRNVDVDMIMAAASGNAYASSMAPFDRTDGSPGVREQLLHGALEKEVRVENIAPRGLRIWRKRTRSKLVTYSKVRSRIYLNDLNPRLPSEPAHAVSYLALTRGTELEGTHRDVANRPGNMLRVVMVGAAHTVEPIFEAIARDVRTGNPRAARQFARFTLEDEHLLDYPVDNPEARAMPQYNMWPGVRLQMTDFDSSGNPASGELYPV